MCPSSNVRLQRVETYSSHPIRALWERQVNLGINTDDPGLFDIDLTGEYLSAMHHHHFSLAEIQQTVLNSVTSAFLSAEKKASLVQEIQQQWG